MTSLPDTARRAVSSCGAPVAGSSLSALLPCTRTVPMPGDGPTSLMARSGTVSINPLSAPRPTRLTGQHRDIESLNEIGFARSRLTAASLGTLWTMQRISLDALATQQLELAAIHGRPAADTVVGGHERVLRQTVIGMLAGFELGEHENPGEATLHVLRGRVRLSSGEASWEGRAGDLFKIPDARHSVDALEDSAVLLTVAMLP